jgi:very-short-patch-repair endonuclease
MTQKSIAQNQRVSSAKVERSRELRADMTNAEKVFWEMVRGKRMFKFEIQYMKYFI